MKERICTTSVPLYKVSSDHKQIILSPSYMHFYSNWSYWDANTALQIPCVLARKPTLTATRALPALTAVLTGGRNTDLVLHKQE